MPSETIEFGRPVQKTILIIDDHPILRLGLSALIESQPDLTICGEAATCRAGLEAIRENQPDLVIVDVVLQNDDGLDLVKTMKGCHAEIPALVLSMHDEPVYAERSLRLGARGYVMKNELEDTLLVAIRQVLNGEIYMSDKLKARLAAKYANGRRLVTDSPLDALSNRELQVFRLIGQGQNTRQIAVVLARSVKTIESHRENIKQKLTLKSAAELGHRATQWVETGRTS